MSPAVDYGYLCRELEGLQELGYKGSIDNVSALGSEKDTFFPKDRMGKCY